jgi:hypothetical protein
MMVYQFTDADIANLNIPVVYYCLKTVDMGGKKLQTGSYRLSEGNNQLVLSTSGLVSGVYTLVIAGEATHGQLKLVKQ